MSVLWGNIWISIYFILYCISFLLLLLEAFRKKHYILFWLCIPLVVWPLVGELLKTLAKLHARTVLKAGSFVNIFSLEMSPGEYITKVSVGVDLLQAIFVLVTTIVLLRFVKQITR
jgi:hypothetical protein